MTEASVKLYQLAKKHSIDPFDIDPINQTTIFLAEAVENVGSMIDLAELAGRYPGTWSLPVCNTSIWGKAWNWDYMTVESRSRERQDGEVKGLETNENAAKPPDFYRHCKVVRLTV